MLVHSKIFELRNRIDQLYPVPEVGFWDIYTFMIGYTLNMENGRVVVKGAEIRSSDFPQLRRLLK